MKIYDYGKWTKIRYYPEEIVFEPGHLALDVGGGYNCKEVDAYKHLNNGEEIASKGYWGTGWKVSEIIGIGVINHRGIKRIK